MLRRAATVATLVLAMLQVAQPGGATHPEAPVPGQPGFNDTVFALLRVGDTIFVGGSFTAAILPGNNSVPRQHLAAMDANTGELLPWAPNVDNTVWTLALDPGSGRIYAGGRFLSVNGATRSRLAAFSAATGALLPWAPRTNAAVRGLDVGPSGIVYAGGKFRIANSTARHRLAAFDAAGALLPWAPSADDKVKDVEVADGIYVGGDFSAIDGVATGAVARIGTDGVVGSWASPIPGPVFSLTVDGGVVYSGAGGPGGHVYAHNAATGGQIWQRQGNGDVQSIDYLPTHDTVLAGGHFDRWAGVSRRWIVELRASDGTMTAWRPSANKGFWSVHATDAALYLGGNFTRIDGVIARRFARWTL